RMALLHPSCLVPTINVMIGNKFKIIHDSVHGSIKVEEPLLSILELPEVQRMSNVRQLGLNYLVFPGANHTRLEHSLGVAHVAGEIGKNLNLKNEENILLKVSGLLHDIGHPPFSHALEDFIYKKSGLTHEDVGEKIIRGEIKLIDDYYERNHSLYEILEKNGIDSRQIISIIKYNKRKMGFNEHNYLGEIISGNLDADQLDYLLRDSHYTGVAFGIIDIQRIYNTIKLLNKEIVFDIKGKEALEGVMVARSLMYSSVYFHKTARIAELMVVRALEKIDADPIKIFSMNDSELISLLINSYGFPREVGLRIKYRNLFKKALIIEEIDESFKKININKIEREIAEEAGIPEEYVIIDAPFNLIDRFSGLDVNILKDGKISRLSSESRLVKAIRSRKPIDYDLMVITKKEYVEIVGKISKKILV
ncbi:MAG: HD domain-containing protein, partial [Thermoplasmata archaeon]